jgi:hypothetical protein
VHAPSSSSLQEDGALLELRFVFVVRSHSACTVGASVRWWEECMSHHPSNRGVSFVRARVGARRAAARTAQLGATRSQRGGIPQQRRMSAAFCPHFGAYLRFSN